MIPPATSRCTCARDGDQRARDGVRGHADRDGRLVCGDNCGHDLRVVREEQGQRAGPEVLHEGGVRVRDDVVLRQEGVQHREGGGMDDEGVVCGAALGKEYSGCGGDIQSQRTEAVDRLCWKRDGLQVRSAQIKRERFKNSLKPFKNVLEFRQCTCIALCANSPSVQGWLENWQVTSTIDFCGSNVTSKVSGEEMVGSEAEAGNEMDEGSHLRVRVVMAMNRVLSMQDGCKKLDSEFGIGPHNFNATNHWQRAQEFVKGWNSSEVEVGPVHVHGESFRAFKRVCSGTASSRANWILRHCRGQGHYKDTLCRLTVVCWVLGRRLRVDQRREDPADGDESRTADEKLWHMPHALQTGFS
ncbi:hypothetical protein DFH09DRAFT_1083152 [Mycena vulgaris]|nr:hypothetical protein DFH09DRAFT_1083152 [Mycena vulgaris]